MDEREQADKCNWYDHKTVVIILLILFFPVGLFAMWKNKGFLNKTKITVSAVFAFLMIIGLIPKNFVTPEAKSYQVIKRSDFSFPGRSRLNFILLAPEATSYTEFAHTAMKAALDKQRETGADVICAVIEPSVKAVGRGDNYAIASYAPDGKGNSGDQDWKWSISVAERPFTQKEMLVLEAWEECCENFQVNGLTDELKLKKFLSQKLQLPIEEIRIPLLNRKEYFPE